MPTPSQKTGWVYSQGTERLTHNGQAVATGYSGAGAEQFCPSR